MPIPRTDPEPRALCTRCRRAQAACWCEFLAPLQSRTRVCFLQHPRERDVAIGTARMAHLSLPNSELHLGVDFEDHPRVQELIARPGTMLLFPGDGARQPEELAAPPETVLVVDGTWSQARKLVQRNPSLLALPRLGLRPAKPGNYRIRKEPEESFVSTIEAVVHLLGALEKAPERFLPILRAFERMVDLQIACAVQNPLSSRYRHPRPPPRPDKELVRLRRRRADVVLVYAEANAHPAGSGVPGPAELVQLVALRPGSGERFEARLAPRRALSPSTPEHLELPAEAILAGEPAPAAMDRFNAFRRPGDLFCSWGHYPLDLIEAETGLSLPFSDLKAVAQRRLRRSAGGLDAAPAALGDGRAIAPLGEGRAGRRLGALGVLFELLLAADSVD